MISHTVKEGALLLEREVLPLQDKTTSGRGLHLRGRITPHGWYRGTRRRGRRSRTSTRVRWNTGRADLLGSRVQISSKTPHGRTRHGGRSNKSSTRGTYI